ncbi:WD40 repeat domain-containing protein [Aquabacterium humicola]|uniref:WD40 repeat domain-containing protein n=1 Tax=Aquabacterium humicola TaxID=3237377 RepID=UPI0025436B8B|nr:WD40 repeat domain-containing protein [Rubrivivax pictus]
MKTIDTAAAGSLEHAAAGSLAHFGPIAGIACSATHIATAGYDNRVILWDRATRQAVAMGLHDHLVNSVAFSPDGQRLVSASSDHTARIWSVPAMQLTAVMSGHADDVDTAVFSPDGKRIATSSHDHTVRTWDAMTGQPLAMMLGHHGDVLALAWDDAGRSLVSSSDDGTVRRWCPDSAVEIERVQLGGAQSDALAVMGDGRLVCGDDTGTIYLVGEKGVLQRQCAHAAGIKFLKADAERQRVLCLSYDGSFSVWQIEHGQRLAEVARICIPGIVWPRSCALAGEHEAVFGTFGSTYASVDLVSGQWQLDPIRRDRSLNAVCAAAGSIWDIGDAGVLRRDGIAVADLGSLCNFLVPGFDTLYAGGQTGMLFDARSARPLHRHASPLNCAAAYRQDGEARLVVGTYTGELLYFAQREGMLVLIDNVRTHENAIKGVAVAHGRVFSCCADGAVALSDAADGRLQQRVPAGHSAIANGCVATADGFASVGRDFKLRLWRRDLQQRCLNTPHRHSIRCIAVSTSGRTLATAGYRGLVALYDRIEDRWLPTLRPSTFGISSIVADPEGEGFIASSYDGATHRIPAPRTVPMPRPAETLA